MQRSESAAVCWTSPVSVDVMMEKGAACVWERSVPSALFPRSASAHICKQPRTHRVVSVLEVCRGVGCAAIA